jgi:hypothetical protein
MMEEEKKEKDCEESVPRARRVRRWNLWTRQGSEACVTASSLRLMIKSCTHEVCGQGKYSVERVRGLTRRHVFFSFIYPCHN